jgi:hypothetical protein
LLNPLKCQILNVELSDTVLAYDAAGSKVVQAQILYRDRIVPNSKTFISTVQRLWDRSKSWHNYAKAKIGVSHHGMAHFKTTRPYTYKKYKPCNQEMTCADDSFVNNRIFTGYFVYGAGFTLAAKISQFKSLRFLLWGHLKQRVYSQPINLVEELTGRVVQIREEREGHRCISRIKHIFSIYCD